MTPVLSVNELTNWCTINSTMPSAALETDQLRILTLSATCLVLKMHHAMSLLECPYFQTISLHTWLKTQKNQRMCESYLIKNEKKLIIYLFFSFWFLVLLACQRKISHPDVHAVNSSSVSKCTWTPSANRRSVISYSIWLVNGHPSSASNKLLDLDYQFSIEQTNLFVYVVLDASYIILLIIQLYALSQQKIRSLNYLFTLSLALHCLAYFFICCHKVVFAHNGKGFETLSTIADIMKIMSTALFILFVLMIAKGFNISKSKEMFSKTIILAIWSLYTLIKILLYIWVKDSLNYIEEVDEYHTLPGWLGLGFRMLLMLWFLHELRHTMILEQDPRKLKFYLHFGAGMLVWFIHLVLVAMVCIQIDLLWRYKIITGLLPQMTWVGIPFFKLINLYCFRFLCCG